MAVTFEQGILPFRQFVESPAAERSAHRLNVPDSRIADEQSFNEIHSYLTDYYAGVQSVHSFVDANGSIFDCIPVEQQFSLRGKTETLPKPPDMPRDSRRAPTEPAMQASRIVQLHRDLTDPFGNQMLAPEGTIPVRRKTLEALGRFRNLREFFQKSPSRAVAGRPPGGSGSTSPRSCSDPPMGARLSECEQLWRGELPQRLGSGNRRQPNLFSVSTLVRWWQRQRASNG